MSERDPVFSLAAANKRRTRAAGRTKVFYQGLLHIRAVSLRCKVRDLSVTGARLELAVPVWAGAPMEIEIGKFGRFPGTVVWAEVDEAGIAFDAPFDVTLLKSIEPSSPPPSHRPLREQAAALAKERAATLSSERSRDAVSALRARSPEWEE
jgi:hypothetical protein